MANSLWCTHIGRRVRRSVAIRMVIHSRGRTRIATPTQCVASRTCGCIIIERAVKSVVYVGILPLWLPRLLFANQLICVVYVMTHTWYVCDVLIVVSTIVVVPIVVVGLLLAL